MAGNSNLENYYLLSPLEAGQSYFDRTLVTYKLGIIYASQAFFRNLINK